MIGIMTAALGPGAIPLPKPLPSFTVLPSITPTSGTAGQTTYTGVDGTVLNGVVVSRRMLLNGSAIGTSLSVVPGIAGSLVLENTATGPGGTVVTSSLAVTVQAAGGAAPTVSSPATLTGTPGGMMTWNAASFSGATGSVSSGVEADGVPVITSTAATGTFDSSAYPGRTLNAYSFGSNGGGTTPSRSSSTAIPLGGYSFTNAGLPQADGTSAASVPGFAILSGTATDPNNPTSPPIVVKGGKLHLQPNIMAFNSGGAVHTPGSSSAMLTFLFDQATATKGGTSALLLAADAQNFVIARNVSVGTGPTPGEPVAIEFGMACNGDWNAYIDFRMLLQVGDSVGFTTSGVVVTIYRKAAGASSFVQAGTVDFSAMGKFVPNKLGTGMGVGWYQKDKATGNYYEEFDFSLISISEAPTIPVTVLSVVEGAPFKLANPTSSSRSLSVSGSYVSISGALEYAIRDQATGQMIQGFTPAVTAVSGGSFAFTATPAFSAAYNGRSCTLIVRSTADTTKFAGFAFTLSSVYSDAVPLRMGMNLGGIANDSTQYPLLDLMKSGGTPLTQGSGSQVLDSDGWPTQVPSGGQSYWSLSVDSPGSNYTLFYDGSQAVSPYDANASTANAVGIGGASNVDYSVAGKITFTAGNNGLTVGISHLNSANRVRNIRIVRNDRQSLYSSGKLFNPDLLAKHGRFSVLRLMDWQDTNNSVVVNWADRSQLTWQNWHALPVEAQAAFGNELAATAGSKVKMLHLCVPARASDAYVTSYLTYLRDNLTAALKIKLEYSNEVWNSGFTAANSYVTAQGQSLFGNIANVDQVYYGYRSAQIAAIAKTVFGASFATRVVCYLGTQAWLNTQKADAIFDGVSRANVGSAASLFSEYGQASYFGDHVGVSPANEADRAVVLGWAQAWGANPTAANLTPLFNCLNSGTGTSANNSIDAMIAYWQLHAQIAAAHGLKASAYEGGLSCTWFMSDQQAVLTPFFVAACADPRMGDCYVRMTNELRKAGYIGLDAFNDIGSIGPFGPWPALPSLYAADTPRWTIMSNVAALS